MIFNLIHVPVLELYITLEDVWLSVRDVGFGPYMGQIAPNGTNSGVFQIQNVLKSDLKSPGFVSLGANLTHVGRQIKSGIPVFST